MNRLPKQQRRNAILRAARSAFARRGFLGTRAEDIATAAGVSAGLLFRYFPTLRDIQRAVLGRELKRSLRSWPRNLSRIHPRMAFQAAAAAFVGSFERDPDSLRLALFGALTEGSTSALQIRREVLRLERGLASLIRAWKARKWIGEETDASGLSRVIASALMYEAIARQLFGLRRDERHLNRILNAATGSLGIHGRAEVRDLSGSAWRLSWDAMPPARAGGGLADPPSWKRRKAVASRR